MVQSSVVGGWWDAGGYYRPWTFPYIGDFPPNTNPAPVITAPNTSLGWKPGQIVGPSREQIEKELLQKIAKELKVYADDFSDDFAIWDWVAEIIERYYVESKE